MPFKAREHSERRNEPLSGRFSPVGIMFIKEDISAEATAERRHKLSQAMDPIAEKPQGRGVDEDVWMSVVCELALGLDAGWAGVTEGVGCGRASERA